jgi:glycosyltransferase involved in cell wall biosynthesis
MKTIKISVAMATYNGEKYLEQQIQSILNQTLAPDELIVCDDASTDGTVAILEKYHQQGVLNYIVNEHRLGFIGNFKKAVSLTVETNNVALCDQDDEWLPDKLEKSAVLLERINDNKIPCLVYTDMTLVDQDGKLLNNSFQNEFGYDKFRHNLQTILLGNFVTGCTILMNTESKRFFAEIPAEARFHDELMALATFTFGKAEYISLPLVKYRKHGNNASINPETANRGRYSSLMNQVFTAIKGKDDFLNPQLEIVKIFYNQYREKMPAEKKAYFEKFIKLEHKSYFAKKLAFRNTIKRFKQP